MMVSHELRMHRPNARDGRDLPRETSPGAIPHFVTIENKTTCTPALFLAMDALKEMKPFIEMRWY